MTDAEGTQPPELGVFIAQTAPGGCPTQRGPFECVASVFSD